MRYRKLTAAGDYSLGSGADFLINSPEAIAQAVSTRLKLWRGEWFIDKSDGTPWAEDVLGKRQQGRSPDAAIKQRILKTQGVTAIESYSSAFDGDSRRFSVEATISTQYGTATISETL